MSDQINEPKAEGCATITADRLAREIIDRMAFGLDVNDIAHELLAEFDIIEKAVCGE